MFQPFCFFFLCCYVGFVFGGFVLFCFVFLFLFLFFFLVLLSVYEKKTVFPAILVFLAMLDKRVVWFLCFMFLFLFVFLLVLFLSLLKNSFVLVCFCVVLFLLSQD